MQNSLRLENKVFTMLIVVIQCVFIYWLINEDVGKIKVTVRLYYSFY